MSTTPRCGRRAGGGEIAPDSSLRYRDTEPRRAYKRTMEAPVNAPLPTTLRARYYAQRLGWVASGVALRGVLGLREPRARISPEAIQLVQERYRALLARDLDNAARGVYPADLLVDMPSRRRLPRFLLDVPRNRRRRAAARWNDLPPEVDLSEYPPYYRRTFHWQTDGWFSRHSASIYDLSVEVLFLGAADAMRRQAIPPIVAEAGRQTAPLRVLDVACGTGRFLGQLARALPGARYTGLDLSAWYLHEAREQLGAVRHLSLVEHDAEHLPMRDASYDVVTCVYLFHELPPRARQQVLTEIARVLRPGGLCVLVDAVQTADAPTLEPVLDAFHESFHEPFFKSYIAEDLAERARGAGLTVERVEGWHVSKVVVARRPDPG